MTKKSAPRKTSKKPARRMSRVQAVARVLAEAKAPLSCGEMVEAMAKKGYWTSPGGKTPASTLYSTILRQIQSQGRKARFRRVERGKFALNP